MWVDKIAKLSSELTIPVLHLGHPNTQEIIAGHKGVGNFTFEPFTDWDNHLAFADKIKKNDMIVLVSAHSGCVSHIPALDNLPYRIGRRFSKHSRIAIFPKQYVSPTQVGGGDDYVVFP